MPDQPSEVNRILSVVQGCAGACLRDLASAPDAPRAEAALESSGGWAVLAVAFPVPADPGIPYLTDCDRDCLALLGQVTEPLSGARACRELEQRGLGVYGLATVKRSLSRLKRLGLLVNSRRSPRGYSLVSPLPLFRRPAAP
jgi:hypothetical protein